MAEKHVVFVFHGMGQFSPGWADDGIKALKEGWQTLSLNPVDEGFNFEFLAIDYDMIFKDYWDAAEEHANRFAGVTIPATSPAILKELVNLISDIDADSFWVSHLADVVLYRGTDRGDLIVHEIAKKMLKTLQEHGSPPYSIIAHSLGTAVASDVARYLLEDSGSVFRATVGKADTIMMMGNVSRLLERSNLFSNASALYPSRSSSKGACRDYIDVNHPLDPFTWLRPFKPPEKWGGSAANIKRYHQPEIQRNDLVPPVNPHSFRHYLSHPAVQAEFFRRTVSIDPDRPLGIDPARLASQLQQYRDTTLSGESRSFADELLEMPTKIPRSLDDRKIVIASYLDTLEKFKPVWGDHK